MKNSADLGGCYPPRPSASVDNTLLDLQNSLYPTKAEFNNCSEDLKKVPTQELCGRSRSRKKKITRSKQKWTGYLVDTEIKKV